MNVYRVNAQHPRHPEFLAFTVFCAIIFDAIRFQDYKIMQTELHIFPSWFHMVGAIQTRKTASWQHNNVIYFKNKTIVFLILSNHLSNFSVTFRHLFSNTRVDLQNRIAYKNYVYKYLKVPHKILKNI